MDEKFAEVYYKPEHLWTGNKAIRKLHKETGLCKKRCKVLVSKASILAGSYTISKEYKAPSLRDNQTQ